MPWHLEKVGNNKYYVVTTKTGYRHSYEPLSYEKARAQLFALNINAR